MAYKYWKLMKRVGVAVCAEKQKTYYGEESFDGYIFDADDKDSQEKAIEWARRYENRYDADKDTVVLEPKVHIFDNEGFTVTILDSAGGSSQGGRLSFWKCRVKKDDVEFVVGINDGILADLIRHSDISDGEVKQKVSFARQSGQPGFIHEGMEAYKEATADMAHKEAMKKAKKTSKWELGGVYSSITMTDICLGPVWDTMEEVEDTEYRGWYPRTKLVSRDKPIPVTAWLHVYKNDEPIPDTLEEVLKKEINSPYLYFSAGKPPARAKTKQLDVKESDQKLLDTFFGEVARHYAERYKELPRFVRKI